MYETSKFLKEKYSALKLTKKLSITSSLFITTFILSIGNAMAQSGGGSSGTMSQNGLGQQLMNMGQEGASTGALLFTYGSYLAALILFLCGVFAFHKNRREVGRHNGLIVLGIVSFVLAGVCVGAPKWINYSANTATHGDAQYSNDKTGIVDIK